VGTHIDINHIAATPIGIEVTANVKLIKMDGRRLVFEVEAYDEVGPVAQGKHERFIINKSKFDDKLKERFSSQDA
jgi:fluoroacetyl-CoA thioesterase